MQVGDVAFERTVWRRPEDITSDPAVKYVAASGAPADLAGQMAAGIAASALALHAAGQLRGSDADAALYQAHRLFTSVMLAPQTYTALANVSGSPLTDSYPSNSYLDDLFWAATWLLRASSAGFRPANASYYYSAARTTFELAFAEHDSMAVSADYVNNVALVHAASFTKDWAFHAAAQSWVWDWICSGEVTYTTFGRAYHEEAMMLGDTALAAAVAATYVHSVQDWPKAELSPTFLTGAMPLHVAWASCATCWCMRGCCAAPPGVVSSAICVTQAGDCNVRGKAHPVRSS